MWLDIRQKTRTDIQEVARDVYSVMAEGRGVLPGDIARSGFCRVASLALKWALQATAEYSNVHIDEKINPDGRKHYYPVVFVAGRLIIADPTWQQFVPQEKWRTSLSPVLVGTSDEAKAEAAVSKGNLKLWTTIEVPQASIDRHPSAHLPKDGLVVVKHQ